VLGGPRWWTMRTATLSRRYLFACLAALLCGGCTPRPLIVFFNQSQQLITLVPGGDQQPCEIKPRAQCSFWFGEYIRIKTATGAKFYRFPEGLSFLDSEEFVEFKPVSRRILTMQIDATGSIYLLPAGSSGPLDTPYRNQLPGFPIRPLKEGSLN
jgi:hypothetical protein